MNDPFRPRRTVLKNLELVVNQEIFMIQVEYSEDAKSGEFIQLHWWRFHPEIHRVTSKLFQYCSPAYKNDLNKWVESKIEQCLSSN